MEQRRVTPPEQRSSEHKAHPSAKEIQAWLVSYMGDLLGTAPEEVSVTVPFERYGLDSAAAVALTGDLGKWLGITLDANLTVEYRTIEAICEFLGGHEWDAGR